MPRETGLPPGTLMMLVLRVLTREPLHRYAIAQRIHQLSADELRVSACCCGRTFPRNAPFGFNGRYVYRVIGYAF